MGDFLAETVGIFIFVTLMYGGATLFTKMMTKSDPKKDKKKLNRFRDEVEKKRQARQESDQ